MTNLKNMSKRGLALFLALVMCLGMMNLTAFAAEDAYVCGLEEHTHTDACYQTQSTAPSPVEGHSHTDGCYSSVCSLEESEGHSHTDACYEIETFTEKVLDCGLSEAEAHTHTDACYTTPASQELVCTLAEGEGGHEHSDSCYTTETITKYRTETYEEEETYTYEEEISVPVEKTEYYEVTDEEGNTSTESRTYTEYETHTVTKEETRTVTKEREVEDGTEEITTLTCGMEPGEGGHVHSESCYETVYGEPSLSCGLTEVSEADAHTHTDACWREDLKEHKVLTCTLEDSAGHTHGDGSCVYELVCGLEECADVQPAETVTVSSEPTCGKDEHVHTVECLAVYAGLTQGLDTLGTAFGAFQEEFSDSWTGGYDDSFQTAFASAAAAQFGEDFNALLTLYKQIPARHFGDEGYAELTGALETFATAMGGSLNSGITLLETATVTSGKLSDVQDAINSGKDVEVTQTVTISSDSTLDLKGKTITFTGSSGSVFHVTGGTFTLKDSMGSGVVTGGKGIMNPTRPGEKGTSGGAIFVNGGTTFIMEGGTLTGNSADTGGAIFIDYSNGKTSPEWKPGTFEMTGGSITNNTANVHEGGGIFCYGNGTISAAPGKTIRITGNKTNTTTDWGGGGVYVNTSGNMTINNAEITDNVAGGLGGGVAGCPHAHMQLSISNGAAIYSNTAYKNGGTTVNGVTLYGRPENDALYQNSNGTGDYLAYALDTGFTAAKAQDFYCVDVSSVQGQGQNGPDGISWTGRRANKDAMRGYRDVSIVGTNWLAVNEASLGLTAVGTFNVSGKSVIISGNTSATHGGGIACNGTLQLGNSTTTTETTNTWSIEAKKELIDANSKELSLTAGQFTFQLLAQSSTTGEWTDVISTATNDADGTIHFVINNSAYAGTATGAEYTFKVKEVPGNDSNITYDTTVKTVTVKVYQDSDTATTGDATVTTTSSYVGSVSWTNADGTSLTDNIFTNIQLTSLAVKKNVTYDPTTSYAPDLDKMFTIVVKLGDSEEPQVDTIVADNHDGIKPAGVDYTGDGLYTMTLKGGETATIKGIPTGTKYEVTEELDSSKWEATIENAIGTVNGQTVTVENHYFDMKKTSVTVEKSFQGGEEYLPEKVTVQLYRTTGGTSGTTSEDVGEAVDLTKENGWTYTWEDQPLYSGEKGKAYTYHVKEVSVSYPELAEAETGLVADPLNGNLIRVRNTAFTGQEIASNGVSTGKDAHMIVGGWLVSKFGSVGASAPNGTVSLTNDWVPAEDIGTAGLEIHKVDALDNSIAIPGVEFTLTGPGAAYSEGITATTDVNGIASFGGLLEGTYTLEEISAPDAYSNSVNLGKTWTITVSRAGLSSVKEINPTDTKPETGNTFGIAGTNSWTLSHDQNGDGVGYMTIANQPTLGSISITKQISGTSKTIDKEFTFRVTGNGVDQEVTVKAGETETISNLRYGTYTITETGGTEVEGFQYNGVTYSGDGSSAGNSWQVNVTSHGTVYAVTADNSYTELGGLSLTKNVTGGDGNRSRDWNFVLTLEGNTIRTAPVFEFSGTQSGDAKYVRNEDGTYTVTMKHGVTLQVTNLSVGTRYSVYEVEANQNGYTTSATKDDVTVPYVDGALTVSGTVAKDEANNVVFTNHNPSTPDNPRTPETPDEPEDPVDPERPEEPTEPETPIEPEIPDEPVPMEDMDLFDDDVPLSSMPEEEETFDEEEILDEEVPLLDVSPETGDHSRTSLWAGLCALSLLGIAALLRKKRDP